MKVKIYYNLHKKLFSVKMGSTVIAHSESLVLKDAVFQVSQKGRQRVLDTGVRNVHAGVTGELIINPQQLPKKMPKNIVRYNPFRSEHFLDEKDQPVKQADLVYFNKGQCFV